MATDVIIPDDLWEEDSETGSTLLWLYDNGTQVVAGQVIAEVLVEKVTLELEAPSSGTLRIRVEPESVVNRGDVVAVIE
ncbi:MAG: biotin attachment protein [Sphingomonas sp.]|nr:MAG: biotin attachment protein [Sphingomonas sp.]